jgi:hypothetical protein
VFAELDANGDGQLSLVEVARLLAHPAATEGFGWAPGTGAVSPAEAALFVRAFRQVSFAANHTTSGSSSSSSSAFGQTVAAAAAKLMSPQGRRGSSMLQAGKAQRRGTAGQASPGRGTGGPSGGPNGAGTDEASCGSEGEVVVDFGELEAMLRLAVLLQALCALNRGWLQQAARQ